MEAKNKLGRVTDVRTKRQRGLQSTGADLMRPASTKILMINGLKGRHSAWGDWGQQGES